MAGTGSNSTAEASGSTKFAARAGADGALLVAPYYNRPTRRASTPISRPWPRASICRSCSTTSPAGPGETWNPRRSSGCRKVGPIVAIKEASRLARPGERDPGPYESHRALGRRQPHPADAGRGGLRRRLGRGKSGPRDVIAMLVAFEKGDLADAHRRHLTLFPLCRDLLGLASNPIPVKTAMAMLGRGNGELRLPLCASR